MEQLLARFINSECSQLLKELQARVDISNGHLEIYGFCSIYIDGAIVIIAPTHIAEEPSIDFNLNDPNSLNSIVKTLNDWWFVCWKPILKRNGELK